MSLRVSLLVFIFSWSFTKGFLSDNEYKKMPPLYIFEDFQHCKIIQGKYCKSEIKLQPLDKNNISETWTIIEKTKLLNFFNHSQIYRGACYENKPNELELEQNIASNFSSDGLLATITSLNCFNDHYSYDFIDFLAPIITAIIVFLTALATYKDFAKRNQKSTEENNKNVLKAFSLRSNWISATTLRRKYAFIEGLRAYSISAVIIIHTLVFYAAFYTENVEYFEKLLSLPLVIPFLDLVNFIVQTFFVVSGLFLGIQIMELYNANKKFTLNDAVLLIINRYLRFLPPHAYLLLFYVNNFGPATANGIMNDIIETEKNICRDGWFYTLFLINNWLPSMNMCAPLTWYLAVDFQMYIMVTIICYICYKFKLNLYKAFGLLSISVIAANVITNYKNKYEIAYPASPRFYALNKEVHDPQFWTLYMSTYSNAVTYMSAVCFGFLTIDLKNSKILDKQFNYFLWHVLSFGLPWVALVNCQFPTKDQLLKSIIGSTIKPTYALGYCFFAAGMIIKGNTWLHKFYTWEPLVFFGTMTYSIYMFHFGGLIAIFMDRKKPIHVTSFSFIFQIIINQILSFIFGFIAFFLFEKPFAILQKRYIPNIKKNQEPEDNV